VQEQIFRGTDHRIPSGTGAWHGCGRGVPASQGQLGNVLQVEGQVGGIEVSDARRLKVLETENARLGSCGPTACWVCDPERPSGKDLTTPRMKRDAALRVMEIYEISQRRGFRLVSVNPETVWRQAVPDNLIVRDRMREIAAVRRCVGASATGGSV
jgi:hypothetical protein